MTTPLRDWFPPDLETSRRVHDRQGAARERPNRHRPSPLDLLVPVDVDRGGATLEEDVRRIDRSLHELSFVIREGQVDQPDQYGIPYTETHTISSGAISLDTLVEAARRIVTLDTEAAAALDDLDTISGGKANDVVILLTAASARDVRLTKAGNLKLPVTFPNFRLNTIHDRAELHYDGADWCFISGSNNG